MNIYVGNLSYDITQDELQQLFAEHGSVVNVNIIKDRDTGNSKGFGFVEMENQSDGENAIKELDGQSVKGRNIKVNQARPRNDRSQQPRRRNW
ncbi:RNA-binding protein [Candidatus Magnetomorum sp. HK-1]|nr:RNA-binding protein [Candidatus Magnetomorum sp. HK-1]